MTKDSKDEESITDKVLNFSNLIRRSLLNLYYSLEIDYDEL